MIKQIARPIGNTDAPKAVFYQTLTKSNTITLVTCLLNILYKFM